MNTPIISKNYLETLSSQDLIALADEYGIDIPENLNRRFIIGELLEIIEDLADQEADDDITETTVLPETKELPYSYNETFIVAMLRNPAWLYVYWDIRSATTQLFNAENNFSRLYLKITFYENADDERYSESFDVSLSPEDRAQYILLSSKKNFVKANLIAEFTDKEPELLAFSKMIAIPKPCTEINSFDSKEAVTPVQALSGLHTIIENHYKNHRQSFS